MQDALLRTISRHRCAITHPTGGRTEARCAVRDSIPCSGPRARVVPFVCGYCFQLTDPASYRCEDNYGCDSVSPPGERLLVKTNCTAESETLCLGRRTFLRQRECNWTSGYRWTTALALSITLGGFGADR